MRFDQNVWKRNKPQPGEAELFEQLVLMVQTAKREGLDVPSAFFEELIDACVLAASEAQIISERNRAKPGSLYFPEEAAKKDLCFIDQVAELLNVDAASCRVAHAKPADRSAATKQDASSTIKSISAFVAAANAPSHPIRTRLAHLTAASPDLFAIIKQESKV
jgi:hypothetical protein